MQAPHHYSQQDQEYRGTENLQEIPATVVTIHGPAIRLTD